MTRTLPASRRCPMCDDRALTLHLEMQNFGREIEQSRGAMPEWRCFHCDDVFTDRESAALHFGSTMLETPACQFEGGVLEELRRVQAENERYREEDAPIHREMRGMASRHHLELQRAEEAGYAKALKDTGYVEPPHGGRR